LLRDIAKATVPLGLGNSVLYAADAFFPDRGQAPIVAHQGMLGKIKSYWFAMHLLCLEKLQGRQQHSAVTVL
jgi:hypothetical protein